jgi:hypothetical protein
MISNPVLFDEEVGFPLLKGKRTERDEEKCEAVLRRRPALAN